MRIIFLQITVFFLLIVNSIKGEVNQYPPFMSNSNDFVERVTMTTDRDIYFIEEELFFEGDLESAYSNWSKVIYVQIISYNGKVQHQSKHKVGEAGNIEGSIKLADNIVTGYYYLRAYTKWMRNYSQYNYFYKPVFIINSVDNKILSVDDNYEAIGEIDTLAVEYEVEKSIIRKCSRFLKENYVDLQGFAPDCSSVSMVKKELVNDCSLSIKREADTIFNYQYLPEIDGLSITGKVVDDNIGVDLERATVFLSVLGDTPYSSVMFTDHLGKFYFNIDDYFGHNEILVSMSSKDGQRVKFLIDNDFCNREIKLPFISPLTLNKEHWESLHSANGNAQIEHQSIKTERQHYTNSYKKQLFYSTPTTRVDFGDYIDMPTIKDYIYELIPMLGIRYTNEAPRIVIKTSRGDDNMKIHNALIIYDGLFIGDVSSLINISPKKIDYLEVLGTSFILGDNTFGGIVNVVSKNKDIKDLDLTESGLFIDYMMFDDNVYKHRLPLKMNKRELLNNNTVLWSLDDEVDQYLVPDREGDYLLLFSKWENGQLLRKAISVNVE